MTVATASPQSSSRSSWDLPSSRSRHSSTPHGLPPRTPASVGQAAPPRASPPSQAPQTPNYFGLVVDSTIDPPDSDDARYAAGRWSPPTSSMNSAKNASPRPPLQDSTSSPNLAAFRRESEKHSFALGHGNLSHFSMNAGTRHPRDAASNKNQADLDDDETSPKSVPGAHDKQLDRMEIDSGYHSGPPSQRPSQSDPASILGMPHQESPAPLPSTDAPNSDGSQSSHVEDKLTRLSLPTTKGPSSMLPATAAVNSSRAETLPASMDKDGPIMVTPQHVANLRASRADEILLLDLRVFPQFSQARITGALNLCIPTTLLKRPSFNLQKLADTFTNEDEKSRFAKWESSKYIIVYDDKSSQKKDALSCVNTLRKFVNEGWRGHAYILTGGFDDFSRAFPDQIDQRPSSEPSSSSKTNLSIEPPVPEIAPVAGGCPMPAHKSAANPFFGNIRQNTDLIGGVGQMPIKRPSGISRGADALLPTWIRKAIDDHDAGKAVSDRFLDIEKAEQQRMQDALSGNVSYGSPTISRPSAVQIAGVEKGGKNRYNNIWPYDHTRVKLEGRSQGACDYVNASHIKASRSNKRYIATQGPLPATFEDFWTVVWDQDVRVIVMLTAENEGGQLKCHPYWKGKDFGALKLHALSEKRMSLENSRSARFHNLQRRSTAPTSDPPPRSPIVSSDQPHVIVRQFSLTHTSLPFRPMREITQLQYSSWPDFGAPAHPTHVLSLVEQCDAVVRATASPALTSRPDKPDPATQRPVLVHCSAGCGRTGTFCTVDSVVDMLKRQRHERLHRGPASPMQIDAKEVSLTAGGGSNTADVDEVENTEWVQRDDLDLIAKTVDEFRVQRLSMVQSLRQFVLCYETVLEWFVSQQLPEVNSKEAARRSYPGL